MQEQYSKYFLNGALNDYGLSLAGSYRGYQLVFTMENRIPALTVSAVSNDDELLGNLKMELLALKKNFPKMNPQSYASRNEVKIYWNTQFTIKKTMIGMSEMVDQLIEYLTFHNYPSGCRSCCKTESATELYDVNGRLTYLCPTCAAQLEQEALFKQEEVSQQSSNLATGFIGALIGSLAGVAVWILLDQIGFIAGISGALMAIGAMWLYAKFGGCLDKKGVICCILVVAVMVFVANYLTFAIAYFKVLKPYGYTFADCLRHQFEFIKLDEIVGQYVLNLVIGYALTAAACVGRFKQAMHQTKGPTFTKLS